MKRLFHRVLLSLLLLSTGLIGSAALAEDPKATTFDQILGHYETVRLALTHDTMEGVSVEGEKIETLLKGLSADWSPTAAGIQEAAAENVRGLLPELSKAATELKTATSLEAARDAFYELSKPLVRWRKEVITPTADDRPTVVYCSMAKRSWLQPRNEFGNPYYGQSMLGCGEVVDG